MGRYFTSIAENELNNDFLSRPIEHISRSFESFADFGWSMSNIIIFPCKFGFLTISVFIESFISLSFAGYYYCQSMREAFDQACSNGSHSALIGLKMLGLFLLFLLQWLIFLLRFMRSFLSIFSRRQNGYTSIHDNPTVRSRIVNDIDPVSDAMDRYTALIEKSGNELDIVAEAMGEIHAEFTVHKERLIAENNKLIAENNQMKLVLASRGCVSKFSCFNEHKKDISLQVRAFDQRKQELIDCYVHLSNTYPIAEFETLESPGQQKLITLSDVAKAYADYEEHHQKVLDIAEQMLEASNVPLHEIRLLVRRQQDESRLLKI